jgi:hypothetical protein
MIINPNILIEPTAAIENEPLFKQIVRQIEDNTFKLSFTKISNFMDSPRSFMQYCMKEQTRTKAMKYGSMIHHWLLEKETFDANYKVAPEVNLTTTIGKDTLIQYLSDLLTGEEFREFEGSFFEQQEEDNAQRLAKFKPTKTKLECEYKNVWG